MKRKREYTTAMLCCVYSICYATPGWPLYMHLQWTIYPLHVSFYVPHRWTLHPSTQSTLTSKSLTLSLTSLRKSCKRDQQSLRERTKSAGLFLKLPSLLTGSHTVMSLSSAWGKLYSPVSLSPCTYYYKKVHLICSVGNITITLSYQCVFFS